MANRLYNQQISPKGYQEGGKVGFFRRTLGKIRKKIAPTFGEQFSKAKKSGKKTFTHKGKKFTTLLKGEKPTKKMPELSGKTSKKIKKIIGA
tara:strand:- start:24 stop:299 length:276 start_codon:yes stop_codon:yes gene_type:complete